MYIPPTIPPAGSHPSVGKGFIPSAAKRINASPPTENDAMRLKISVGSILSTIPPEMGNHYRNDT